MTDASVSPEETNTSVALLIQLVNLNRGEIEQAAAREKELIESQIAADLAEEASLLGATLLAQDQAKGTVKSSKGSIISILLTMCLFSIYISILLCIDLSIYLYLINILFKITS
jgi:hypothetical protein